MSRQYFYQTIKDPQPITLEEAIKILLRVEQKMDIIRRDLHWQDPSKNRKWVPASIIHGLTLFKTAEHLRSARKHGYLEWKKEPGSSVLYNLNSIHPYFLKPWAEMSI
jgi:hypothetical protein